MLWRCASEEGFFVFGSIMQRNMTSFPRLYGRGIERASLDRCIMGITRKLVGKITEYSRQPSLLDSKPSKRFVVGTGLFILF